MFKLFYNKQASKLYQNKIEFFFSFKKLEWYVKWGLGSWTLNWQSLGFFLVRCEVYHSFGNSKDINEINRFLYQYLPEQRDLPCLLLDPRLRPLLTLYYVGCLQGTLKEDRTTRQEQMPLLASFLSKN